MRIENNPFPKIHNFFWKKVNLENGKKIIKRKTKVTFQFSGRMVKIILLIIMVHYLIIKSMIRMIIETTVIAVPFPSSGSRIML